MTCSITNRIKSCRELRKLSVKELADLVGVREEVIKKVESGSMIPSKDFLLDLGDVLQEDFVNETKLKNLKLFDLLDSFYDLQIKFLKFKEAFIGTEEYNKFLDSCIYRKGLIYPIFLGDLEISLEPMEILLFYSSIEVLKLKMEMITKKRG